MVKHENEEDKNGADDIPKTCGRFTKNVRTFYPKRADELCKYYFIKINIFIKKPIILQFLYKIQRFKDSKIQKFKNSKKFVIRNS